MEPATVCQELKHLERVLGDQQDQYTPLPCLMHEDGRRVTRWVPNDEERQMLANGADIILTVLTFNEPFQPVRLRVAPQGPAGNMVIVEELS